jgi:threonine aldolase
MLSCRKDTIMPAEMINKLQEKFFFYVWNQTKSEVRIMTSFDTSVDDIDAFAAELLSY